MRLFVLGATGKTGTAIVSQALERGHSVTTFGRREFDGKAEKLTNRTGDVLNVEQLAAALTGHDAVLYTLGSRGLGRTTLRGDSIRATLEAMRRSGVRRLIVLSSSLAEPSGWITRFAARTILRHHSLDQIVMERLVMASDTEWTIVRPSEMTNGSLTGRYRATTGPSPKDDRMVSRRDVAHLMLFLAEHGDHVREIVWMRGGFAR